MQIIGNPKSVAKSDITGVPLRKGESEDFRDYLAAFNHQFSPEAHRAAADQQQSESAVPLFGHQPSNPAKINNIHCPQQKHKRRQKQR